MNHFFPHSRGAYIFPPTKVTAAFPAAPTYEKRDKDTARGALQTRPPRCEVYQNLLQGQPQRSVGVVGRTGAGKSSLVLALLRALTPSGGRILIDGVDIASVKLQKLRTVITVIPQDPCMMRGSLRDIIDPTRKHTDEEVWQALDEAHLREFVQANPNNLLLKIEDAGSNLSVGQQQLVSLARALLRSPRVLLLDEATSHMDGDTDKLIQATLRKSFARCTVLTIAHRLHTVLDYDKILVMAGGKVVEFGPTRELSSNPRSIFYAMLQRAGLAQKNDASDHT